MIVFEPLLEFQWIVDGKLRAVYQPGLRYTIWDEDEILIRLLPLWAEENRVKIIAGAPSEGAPSVKPSQLNGQKLRHK